MFLVSNLCFFSFSTQSHAESFTNFLKNSNLNPKRAKLNHESKNGHVRALEEGELAF